MPRHDDEYEHLLRHHEERLDNQERMFRQYEERLHNQERMFRHYQEGRFLDQEHVLHGSRWLRLGALGVTVVALASAAAAGLGLVTASDARDSAEQAKHCSIAVAEVSRLDQTRAAANRVQDGHLTQDQALMLQEQLVEERATLKEEAKVRGCIDEQEGRRLNETLSVLDEAIHNLHGVSLLLETPHGSPSPAP